LLHFHGKTQRFCFWQLHVGEQQCPGNPLLLFRGNSC
jgi:hypothetical protein